MGMTPSTAGIWFDSLAGLDVAKLAAAPAAGTFGVVTASVPIYFLAGTTTYLAFPADGASYSTAVIGFSGILSVAGAVGQTIQLQTSAGVALTDAINLAALGQWAPFSFGTLNYNAAVCNPHGNFRVVTTGATAPTGFAEIRIVRINA